MNRGSPLSAPVLLWGPGRAVMKPSPLALASAWLAALEVSELQIRPAAVKGLLYPVPDALKGHRITGWFG